MREGQKERSDDLPLLDAAFAVVPDPMTVNLVQSSAVPRWATGMIAG